MKNLINWDAIHKLSHAGLPGRKHSKEEANAMWSKNAVMYNFMAELEKEYTMNQVHSMIFDKEDSVLDIGCGIGRLTVPVAERVKKVTAVDVADKMLELCKENVKKAGLENVTFKSLDWNEVEVGTNLEKHDIVYASRTVALKDVVKLNNMANKYVYLLSFSQYPSLRDVQMELLEGIRGIEKRKIDAVKGRMFGYNVTFNLLYDLGIDPMVKVVDDGFERYYDSKEEAYNDLRQVAVEFGEDYALTDEEEALFRQNVDKYLSAESEKYRFLRTTKTFIIGWKPANLADAIS